MTFDRAKSQIIPLGKFRGQTIEEASATDSGLRYLDWMLGRDWINGPLRDAIETYMNHPSIARELANLIGD
jgi:hypothetical protein